MSTTKRTDQLRPGDRVELPGSRVRTVGMVMGAGYVNRHDVELLDVMYVEGSRGGWGPGNSAAPGSTWRLAP